MPAITPASGNAAKSWTSEPDQRAAATAFLRETQTNNELRLRVAKSGRDDRAFARSEFARIGQIDVPADVEFICLEPGTVTRAKLVVLVLPSPTDPLPSDLASLKYWLAAWVPYNP
jgi:hypothetical protein